MVFQVRVQYSGSKKCWPEQNSQDKKLTHAGLLLGGVFQFFFYKLIFNQDGRRGWKNYSLENNND